MSVQNVTLLRLRERLYTSVLLVATARSVLTLQKGCMIGSENVVETLSVLTCPYATKFHTSCTYPGAGWYCIDTNLRYRKIAGTPGHFSMLKCRVLVPGNVMFQLPEMCI